MVRTDNSTESNARWKDYRDLVPGFSSLHERVAEALFSEIKTVSYQPAETKNEARNEVNRLSGVGFIQIDMPRGYILMVPELKRAYVYPLPGDTTTKGAADALLTAAE